MRLAHYHLPLAVVSLKLDYADVCSTSIFSGSWLCSICAREVCADCYESIQNHENLDPDMFKRGNREVNSIHRKHHYCMYYEAHFAADFVPISRFDKDELKAATTEMMQIISSARPSHDSTGSEADAAPGMATSMSELVFPSCKVSSQSS